MVYPDMERQTIVLGVSLAVLLSLGGFYAAFLADTSTGDPEFNRDFPMEMNVTVDSDNQIEEVTFNGSSMELMSEDTEEARFYFDFNMDGSFDREISIEHDNATRTTSELIELDNKTYRAYFRYRDDPEVDEDAFMTLYRIEKP